MSGLSTCDLPVSNDDIKDDKVIVDIYIRNMQESIMENDYL